MKQILCFGDSNTWGYDAITDGRFPDEVRWTGKLQEKLGAEYTVIEEGLCGRTLQRWRRLYYHLILRLWAK